ncbi:hypothetical protein EDB19DRAFT_1834576 [Suillus lakei]|nr:hypothetical protein EDB19DRAFT_1834576 [Suillus lakei]
MSKSESEETAAMRIVRADPGAGPNFGCKVIVQAQDSCTASSNTCQTHKRKIGGVDTVNKENILFLNGIPATKHICREKTGTNWQTVLNVTVYGEEQQIRQDQDIAVTVEEKWLREIYLQ